jgi:hypothetical protein
LREGEIVVVTQSHSTGLSGADDWSAIAEAIRAWEPAIEIDRGGPQGRLYDPDATTYAVCLGPACTLSTDRRRVAIAPGDLAVVPAGRALEVDPEAAFVAIRHLGQPPYHFRERFIQVWGFEHIPAAIRLDASRLVLDAARGTHRLSYRVLAPDRRSVAVNLAPATIGLMVGLSGSARIRVGAHDEVPLGQEMAALVPPGERCEVSGSAAVALCEIETELAHEARVRSLSDPSHRLSPDFRPDRTVW